MCIIAVCQDRKLTNEEFDRCWESNPDGFGYGFLENGSSVFEKGFMTRGAAKKAYRKIRKLPHVCHFRIGTSGDVCEELTHPFISGEIDSPPHYHGKKDVFFHNGMISSWKDTLIECLYRGDKNVMGVPINKMSDTRLFSYMRGGQIRDEDDVKQAGTELKKTYSKFVFLCPLLGRGTIITIGDFLKESGVMFSNSGYKYQAYANYAKGYGSLFPKAAQHYTRKSYEKEYFDVYGSHFDKRGGWNGDN